MHPMTSVLKTLTIQSLTFNSDGLHMWLHLFNGYCIKTNLWTSKCFWRDTTALYPLRTVWNKWKHSVWTFPITTAHNWLRIQLLNLKYGNEARSSEVTHNQHQHHHNFKMMMMIIIMCAFLDALARWNACLKLIPSI